VRLISATGFHHTFTAREVEGILLATHVGGEPLSAWHGAPLRAIVPERRGWFWVKWITRVELLDNRLEVLAGILAAPREVLRQM
jgi:DMSO/TMAO reductase YedYZ molybdopterin-dependent catalytic subunit